MIDLHQLRIFSLVAEKKSFTEAAEAMYLTQPTVSSHIKLLENDLGVTLFDRLPRGVELTGAGEIMYRYSKEILALHRQSIEAIQEYSGSLRGILKIGGSNIPGEYIVPNLLKELRRAAPEIKVHLQIADTREITALVTEGALEVGMVGGRPDQDVLEHRPYCRDRMVMIVPAAHPLAKGKVKSVSWLKILTEPVWLREAGSGTRKTLLEAMEKHGKQPTDLMIAGELGSTEAVKQAVRAGEGVSIVSSFSVGDDGGNGRLWSIELDGLDLDRSFYLIRHRYRTPSPAARFSYELFQSFSTETA